jgi:hypothetical protein
VHYLLESSSVSYCEAPFVPAHTASDVVHAGEMFVQLQFVRGTDTALDRVAAASSTLDRGYIWRMSRGSDSFPPLCQRQTTAQDDRTHRADRKDATAMLRDDDLFRC